MKSNNYMIKKFKNTKSVPLVTREKFTINKNNSFKVNEILSELFLQDEIDYCEIYIDGIMKSTVKKSPAKNEKLFHIVKYSSTNDFIDFF